MQSIIIINVIGVTIDGEDDDEAVSSGRFQVVDAVQKQMGWSRNVDYMYEFL